MALVRLVTFDVTNTIIRVAGSIGEQYCKIGRIYGVDTDPTELTQAFKEVWKDINHRFPNFGKNNGISSYNWWSQVVADSFRHSGYTGSLTNVAAHLYKHFTTNQAWELTSGSHLVLQEIKKRNVNIGVISNFDERLETVLTCMTLKHYFNFVVVSANMNCEKPDPRIFHHALRLGNAKPEETIHVGDDVSRDYMGARNIGMTGLLFSRENQVPPDVDGNFVIDRLEKVIDFIDKTNYRSNGS